jgi:hypothetical protein
MYPADRQTPAFLLPQLLTFSVLEDALAAATDSSND